MSLHRQAERLSKWKDYKTFQVVPVDDVHLVAQFADAYLAEHPADDDEQHVLGLAGESNDELYLRRVEVHVAGVGRCAAFLTVIDKRRGTQVETYLRDVETKGDVRRLVAALGITVPQTSSES